MRQVALALLVAAMAAPAATRATAQESENRVSTQTDWSVFVEDDPRQCWIVSAPKSIRNTRDGREVQARRGDIRLFVSRSSPARTARARSAVTGGYPYRGDSTVTLTIGSDTL